MQKSIEVNTLIVNENFTLNGNSNTTNGSLLINNDLEVINNAKINGETELKKVSVNDTLDINSTCNINSIVYLKGSNSYVHGNFRIDGDQFSCINQFVEKDFIALEDIEVVRNIYVKENDTYGSSIENPLLQIEELTPQVYSNSIGINASEIINSDISYSNLIANNDNVNYNSITALLIDCVKELNQTVQQLNQKIVDLENQINSN